MTAPNVRIGLVGVANHGNTIFEAIRAAGNFDLVSCFDIDRSAAGACGVPLGGNAGGEL